MRALLLFGGLAAGVLFYIYEFYQNRNNSYQETPHGYGGAPMSEDDIIDLDHIEPAEARRRLGPNRTLPAKDEVCSICLDKLIRRDADCRYCIISLPECGHWFHQKCAIRLLEYHPMCPVCRTSIDGTRLRGTPVRVLQASDVEHGESTQQQQQQQPSQQEQQPRQRRQSHQRQQPIAGCSSYQVDDDLD